MEINTRYKYRSLVIGAILGTSMLFAEPSISLGSLFRQINYQQNSIFHKLPQKNSTNAQINNSSSKTEKSTYQLPILPIFGSLLIGSLMTYAFKKILFEEAQATEEENETDSDVAISSSKKNRGLFQFAASSIVFITSTAACLALFLLPRLMQVQKK